MHAHRARTVLTGTALAAVFAIGVAGLASCTSPSSPARDAVAHLPSTGVNAAGTSHSSADPATGTPSGGATTRPRSKLFETEKETEANMIPYANCMRAHHVPVSPQGRPDPLTKDSLNRYGPAHKACAGTLPLPPVEQDPANPKALGFNRAVAACVRSHGATDVTIDNSNGYITLAFGDSHSIDIGLRYTERCERSVSAKGNH